MSIFTFFADYDGGTYISQVKGTTPRTALRAWLREFDFSVIPRLSTQDVEVLRRNLSAEIPTPVSLVRNVWCISDTLSRGGLLIHLIKTSAR